MTSLELVGLNIEGRALFLRSMPLLVLRSSRCDQVIDMVCIWMTTMDKRSKLVFPSLAPLSLCDPHHHCFFKYKSFIKGIFEGCTKDVDTWLNLRGF